MKVLDFEVENIIIAKRKTLSLEVLPNGNLQLKVPRKLSQSELENIIHKHRRWIQKRKLNFKENNYTPKNFNEGEEIILLGQKFTLKFQNGVKYPKIEEHSIIIDNTFYSDLKSFFVYWYRNFALDFFKKRAAIYSQKMGLKYNAIKVSNAQTRWGSCSSLGNINLSWRLIMADIKVIDYVVIHELAHLAQPNHSPKFWAIVEKIQPEYKTHRKWLKEKGHILNF